METLALLDDPIDQARLSDAAESHETGELISGEEMSELMAQRCDVMPDGTGLLHLDSSDHLRKICSVKRM